MKTISVLINSFNYGRFIAEAVESALKQNPPPTEIIVVDDGSTDDTLAVLGRFADQPAVKVISQRNAGQLGAFVAGFEHATGDYVFMLDADDRYEPGHLAGVTQAFETHREVDFVFTAHRQFGDTDSIVQLTPQDQALGFSVVGSLVRAMWVGSATSTLAMRRSLVLTLLPVLRAQIPLWRIRADDCLVLGSSVAGSRKYYLSKPTVGYRVHGSNHFHRKANQTADDYAHWLRRESFKNSLARHLGLPADIATLADWEFACLPAPSRSDYREYVKIVWGLRCSWIVKLKKRLKLWTHFKKSSRNGG